MKIHSKPIAARFSVLSPSIHATWSVCFVYQIFSHFCILIPMMLSQIPNEVLHQHILALLPTYSLIACCMVAKRLQKYCSRLLAVTKLKRKAQKDVFCSLFAEGVSSLFLEWYQKHLLYPVCGRANHEFMQLGLSLAAKGAHPQALQFVSLN